MNKIIFNDPINWLELAIQEVKDSYLIPDFINKTNCLFLSINVGAFAIVNNL